MGDQNPHIRVKTPSPREPVKGGKQEETSNRKDKRLHPKDVVSPNVGPAGDGGKVGSAW